MAKRLTAEIRVYNPSELCSRMMIFSSSKVFFVLIVSFCVAEGTLEPNGMVSVDCGSAQTFTCRAPGKPIGWNIAGLCGIIIPGPFLARNAAIDNPRISTNDTGSNRQVGLSYITISGFSTSDNGGIIQCVSMYNNSTQGMATISVGLYAPTNVVARAETCNIITLRWDQPSEPNDITTSVSCTPPSPGCAECTTSPCTITGLNPSTEYVFTVTLNSGGCRASMNSKVVRTKDLRAPANVVAKAESCNIVTLKWDQPSEPNDITTSVSCTPPSPGCAECTTSPCTITGLNPSTDYVITVTLNSVMCGSSMNATGIRTRDLRAPTNVIATVRSHDTVTLQWDQPSEPNDITTSVSCTPPSPGCAECTTSPCTITGLNPRTEYVFTVSLNSGGCRSNANITVETACKISSPTCTSQSALLLAGIPTVVLLLVNIISVVAVFLITRHCYKKTSQKSSPSKGEDVYGHVEEPKTYEDIVMTDSPAYGPVK